MSFSWFNAKLSCYTQQQRVYRQINQFHLPTKTLVVMPKVYWIQPDCLMTPVHKFSVPCTDPCKKYCIQTLFDSSRQIF